MNQANTNQSDAARMMRLLVLARKFSSTPTKKWSTWLRSPLDRAARIGNLSFVDFILRAGADAGPAGLDADGGAGRSRDQKINLMASAAFGGNPRVVSALFAAGSGNDINMADTSTGEPPLNIAVRLGHRPVVQLLLRLGAEVNALALVCPGSTDLQQQRQMMISKRSIQVYKWWSSSPLQGLTALHVAAAKGHWKISADLVMCGALTEAVMPESLETPMHLAARQGYRMTVGILLAGGAAPKALSRSNLFPMDLAACRNHSSTIREFLKFGIDPNTENALGYTALHQAAYHDAVGALQTLVHAGGNLKATTKNGHTPLHVAVFSTPPGPNGGGSEKSWHDARPAAAAAATVYTIVKYRDVDIDATDLSGATPLHMACTHLREGAVEELLKIGADASLVRFPSFSGIKATMAAKNKNPGGFARVQAMLTAARAEAAWRRRGWLVLFRTRELALARQKYPSNFSPPVHTTALGNMSGKYARKVAIGSSYSGGEGGESSRGKRRAVSGSYLGDNRRPSIGQRGHDSEIVRAWGGSDWLGVSAPRGGRGERGVESLRAVIGRTTALQDVTVFRMIVAFL